MGEILPELFMPSVSSTTIFDLAGVSRRRLTQVAMAEPMAVPSSTAAGLDAVEILLKPIVIERQRADEVGRAGKRDDANAVVGPGFDELRDDGFHDINAVDRLAVDFEVQRLHRAGHIQREHDVNAAGLHCRVAVAELRPRQADDQQRQHGQDRQSTTQRPARLRVSRATCRARTDVGVFDGGGRAAPSAPAARAARAPAATAIEVEGIGSYCLLR